MLDTKTISTASATKYNISFFLSLSLCLFFLGDTTRKTTFKERIKIVEYCTQNNNNYALTAKEFQVSYGQVYSWVHKYNVTGVDGLHDCRGKRKAEDSLSENERLQIELRMLKAENKKQQMEIDFLKKLEEIERRRF